MMKQDFSGPIDDDVFSEFEKIIHMMNNNSGPTTFVEEKILDMDKNGSDSFELSDITREFIPETKHSIELKQVMNGLYVDPSIDKKPFMEPIRITALGAGLTAVAGAMTVVPETAVLAVVPYIGATATDFFDGYEARRTGRTSKEGAKFDPLVDKAKNLIIGGTLIAYALPDPDLAAAVTSTFAATWYFDYQSQKLRGDILPQIVEGIEKTLDPSKCTYDSPRESNGNRAIPVGKIKTGLQNAAALYALAGIGVEAACQLGAKYFGIDMPEIVSSGVIRDYIVHPTALTLAFSAGCGYLSVRGRK